MLVRRAEIQRRRDLIELLRRGAAERDLLGVAHELLGDEVADEAGAAVERDAVVARAHRGNRLGLAVKTANLRELARVDPGRRHVETMNAEDNPWMVQINIDLGFEVIEEALMLRKNL